jgi:alanyl-tRNA synthetase
VHAGELVKQIAPLLGGGGGGSPEMAVAGGKDPSGIDRALDEARHLLIGG